ncbi:HpcH/HpaI aldolase family protein [Membranihabitans maritimus]|uniref:HpcH/HpaI aldolase family protein n=1 Tax=Membranihabitans maritimus TaxID=2904244 RepID=UPI001F00DE49
MDLKNLSAELRNGKYVFGTAMISQSVLWPKILASLGLDLVFIDTEHTALDRETVSINANAYKAHGIVPIVRIPSPDPYEASKVLDGGAMGVIAPYIENADQVRQLVGAVKFKPLKGKKLERYLMGDIDLEDKLSKYLNALNEKNVLIINIESVPALENLDEILSVKGLDGVLVGPHDLSCSLAVPEDYDHPLFMDAIKEIISKCKRNKVGVGIHVWDEVGFKKEIEWAKMGANLIMHSNDLSIFSGAMAIDLQNVKKELGLDWDRENSDGVTI